MRLLTMALTMCLLCACGGNDEGKKNNDDNTNTQESVYAKGADVSWLTEMEADGKKFYNSAGQEQDCMETLKALGMDAIRLRVWVDPDGGWCNSNDVLAKARRAHKLGMRLLVNFHYSDFFADPSRQTKPAAWANMTVDELCSAITRHTTQLLTALATEGITPEWVEVGNETTNGMLWPEGKVSGSNFATYARLVNAGYNAVKSVSKSTKVVVHIDRGSESSLYTWFFDGLKAAGGKWDVVGMSLYPEKEDWKSKSSQTVANIRNLVASYSTEVLICEVGMPYDAPNECKEFVSHLIAQSSQIKGCLGLFYWEPECYGGWKPNIYNSLGWSAYTKGAFDNSGRPTAALDAFK